MVTMYDVVLQFTGQPANDLESFLAYMFSVVLSMIFVFMILWAIVRVGSWLK